MGNSIYQMSEWLIRWVWHFLKFSLGTGLKLGCWLLAQSLVGYGFAQNIMVVCLSIPTNVNVIGDQLLVGEGKMKKLILVFLMVLLTSCIIAPFGGGWGGGGHGRGYHGNYGSHGRR